jgi:DNA-binding GntR family transcriptional regulator
MKSTLRLKPAKASVQTFVIKRLREPILSGQLLPGDPIMELHVARELKVSQTTVREALNKLVHEGLVRRVPNVGTFVTQLSAGEIRERVRLRILLEALAGMEAARFSTPEGLAELEKRRDAISSAVVRNQYFEAAQADLEFHRAIWRQSRDQTLIQILEQLTVPLFAFVSMHRRRTHQELVQVVRAHDPIVETIKSGDPQAVREAVQGHIESSYSEFLGGPDRANLYAVSTPEWNTRGRAATVPAGDRDRHPSKQ